MICASTRAQRMITEECLKWVSQRKAFGKPLSSQAVVRAKLAQMIARAEGLQAWLENVTYQMCNMVSMFIVSLLTVYVGRRRETSRIKSKPPNLRARSPF